jgi:hypothetical protein
MDDGSLKRGDVFSDEEEIVVVLLPIADKVMVMSFQLDVLNNANFMVMDTADVYLMKFNYNLLERVDT